MSAPKSAPPPSPGSSHPFLDHPRPIPFAHRGIGEGVTENTAAAFEAVAALGYRYVETDVRTTRDGRLVVLHDRSLARVFGVRRDVRDLTWRELRTAAGDVSLLTDVLEHFPDLRFNVDLKDDAGVPAMAAVLASTRVHDRVCVASFSERRLMQVRRLVGPGLCTGFGVRRGVEFAASTLLGVGAEWVRRRGGAVIQAPFRMGGVGVTRSRFVAQAQRLGLQYHVWTLDDVASIRAALDVGVDGIMTDAPLLLRAELRSRGLWVG